MGGGRGALIIVAGTPAFAGLVVEYGSGPGDEGWYGPQWDHSAEGDLLPAVVVTPRGGGADYELEVLVQGLGVDVGWSTGPYTDETVPFSVPIDLPPEANGPGLVEVHVLLTATDPQTGAVIGHEQTPAAYVQFAGEEGETWYDRGAAHEHVVQSLPFAPPEGRVEEEAPVGWEVTP